MNYAKRAKVKAKFNISNAKTTHQNVAEVVTKLKIARIVRGKEIKRNQWIETK
jgi:hypothetical protein